MVDEPAKMRQELFAGRNILLDSHPGARPLIQVPAVGRNIDADPRLFYVENVFLAAMELTTILNQCYPQPGFVYHKARFRADKKAIEVPVRPRKGSKAVCARCEKPAPGYDTLPARMFEFIPFWGFVVFLIYARRRVQCAACGIGAEKLPWCEGKQHSTQAHLLFLAAWARKLSWTEVAASFLSSWDRVHDAVEYVVEWGLQQRSLESIFAIGVDEIQYAKGHKYLTLVYQIDRECIRLLWVGKERTIESFRASSGDRREGRRRDSIRLLGYVEALPGCHQ